MIKVRFDENLNTLIIEYTGDIELTHAEQFLLQVEKLTPQGKSGFKVLADLSGVRSIKPGIHDSIKKVMDHLNDQGVTEIIRVIPDPSKDIGLSIMSLFHYSKDVKISTLQSQEEAWSRLKPKSKAKFHVPGTVAFVEMKDAWEKDFIEQNLSAGKMIFLEETAQDTADKLSEVTCLSVFVNSRVSAAVMEKMPKLKHIATRSTGFDHIDLKTAKEKGITVSNVPVYGENTVAEHTFALILSLSRNLRQAYLRTVKNDFSLDGLMGFDLQGKTLGVIGTGHIGIHVIRMALGFGMKVAAYDVKQQHSLAEVLKFQYLPLEELLQSSDIITLHAPYLPSTRHLINKKNIGLIKKGACLVNTARGGLVETDALIEALDKKILSGVGLDVLEEEEYLLEEKRLLHDAQTEEHWKRMQTTIKNHVLLQRENVIYTPHMAFYSYEAVQRILETTVQNIHGFFQNTPQNIVS